MPRTNQLGSGVANAKAAIRSIEDADGFVQVFPEPKFDIVDMLQKAPLVILLPMR